MKKTIVLFLFTALFSTNVIAQLGAGACISPTDFATQELYYAHLRMLGYEPVKAHGAKGDNVTDDIIAFEKAIKAAFENRRAIYVDPGTYVVSRTILLKQIAYGGSHTAHNTYRIGHKLIGSYCGNQKPTIKLQDGVATGKGLENPYPVIRLIRYHQNEPTKEASADTWNNIIRNLKVITGSNSQAVGVRAHGAEGCSVQEVDVDATGGFAGFYDLNGSGGYTYNISVTGGQYGLYITRSRGGAILVTGLTLIDQEIRPIVIDRVKDGVSSTNGATGSFTPFGVVGFNITSDLPEIISTGQAPNNKLSFSDTGHDTAANIFLVDGQIKVTGGNTNLPIIHNTNQSIYLRNVYFKGRSNIIIHDTSGKLRGQSNSWNHVSEYSYAARFPGANVQGGNLLPIIESLSGSNYLTDNTYYDGAVYGDVDNIVLPTSSLPLDLISRHTYEIGLFNPEGVDVVWVTDPQFGADPGDNSTDHVEIQNAIDYAQTNNKKVFLPAGNATGSLAFPTVSHYKIAGSLNLKATTVMFGVSRDLSVLDARDWVPSGTNPKPIIKTPNNAAATTSLADFKMWIGAVGVASGSSTYNNPDGSPTGLTVKNYDNYAYVIDWQVGRNSLIRDLYTRKDFGSNADRILRKVTNSGGGKWYGITQSGTFPPNGDRNFFSNGVLKLHPDARHLLIKDTTEPLSFYPFHCQHFTDPKASLWEIDNAQNVTIYGAKSEMAATGSLMAEIIDANIINQASYPDLVPVWLRVRNNSKNINIIGLEGTYQTWNDQGLIEVDNTCTDVTISSMGRRGNPGESINHTSIDQDLWYLVKQVTDWSNTLEPNPVAVNAAGFLSLYKSKASTAPAANLVTHIDFSEGSGSEASDLTSFGNDAKFDNLDPKKAWVQDLNSCSDFINLTGDKDKLVIENSSELNIENEFTLSAWVLVREFNPVGNNQDVIITKGNGADISYRLGLDNNKKAQIRATINGVQESLQTTQVLTINKWYHLVGTYDGSMLKIFVDGVESGSKSASGTLTLNTDDVTIGTNQFGGLPFNGYLDEVRIHDYALDQSSISDLIDCDRFVPSEEVVHLDFHEGSGSLASDLTTFGNDARFDTLDSKTAWIQDLNNCSDFINLRGDKDKLVIENSSELNIENEFTLSAWVLVREFNPVGNNQDVIITKGNGADISYRLGLDNNKKAQIRATINGVQESLQTTQVLTRNKWYHLLGTYDGSVLKIFVDGVESGSKSASGTLTLNTDDVTIGTNQFGGLPFNGYLDEVRIHDYALDQSSISDLIDCDRFVPSEEVVHLDFHEGSGSLASDLTTFGNDARFDTPDSKTAWIQDLNNCSDFISLTDDKDKLVIQNSSELNIENEFTLSAWVFITEFNSVGNNQDVILTKGNGADISYRLGFDKNKKAQIRATINGVQESLQTTQVLTINKWYHLVGTYDGSMLKIFINGVESGSKNASGALTLNTDDVTIGANQFGGLPFNGYLDEVRIHDYALNQSSISNLIDCDRFVPSTKLTVIDFDLEDTILYPNPIENYITIKAKSPIDGVEVYNIAGQNILSIKNTSFKEKRIDLSNFHSGVYLIKIKSEGKLKIFKLNKL